jgi:HNH endonuclease
VSERGPLLTYRVRDAQGPAGGARRCHSEVGGNDLPAFCRCGLARHGDRQAHLGTDPARFDLAVRQFYVRLQPDLECVWTGKRLAGDFDVKHAIPFALWQDSSLWNLFPAAKVVNSQKRDRLPSRDLVRKRSDAIIEDWRALSGEFPDRFPLAVAVLMQDAAVRSPPELAGGWERALFSSFVEAIETPPP